MLSTISPMKIDERSFALRRSLRRRGLEVETLGRGQPVVLLHGLGSSLSELRPLAREISTQARAILLDLPGFGASNACLPTDLSGYARAVLTTLDELGLEQATILGCSFGGHVALRLALLAPSRVSGLVLVNSGGLCADIPPAIAALYSEAALAARSDAQVEAACAALIGKPGTLTEDFTARRLREHQLGDYRAIARAAQAAISDRAGAVLGTIQQPVQMIHGERDQLVPLALAQHAVTRFQKASLQVLPGLGHMPWLEDPRALASSVRLALDALPSPR